jgi:carboxyl-terminal processing protease
MRINNIPSCHDIIVRVVLSLTMLATAALLPTLPSVVAQVPETGDAVSQTPQVAQPTATFAVPGNVSAIIEKGRSLERQNRWLEAQSFYDKATRENPAAEDLKLRLTLTQIHCDLDRRNADRSFQRLLDTLTESQAKEMLSEIILKVQTHFVNEPDWQQVAWRGTANLDIALTKPPAQARYFPQATKAQINNFRHLLRDDVNRRTVESRRDVQNLATYTGQLAARELGMDSAVAIMEYCCGAIAALDKYSTYLTGGQLDDVYNQIEGNFVGLGIELKAEDNCLRIVKVIPGGPADEANIVAGDCIIAVDGKSTQSVSTENAAELLKGELHSTVLVTVRDTNQISRDVRVRRDRVEVPSVEDTRIIDTASGVGYFRLTSFQKTTSRDVDAALWQLHRQGMRSLIVDVRGNPGGLLTAAVEVADKFLTDGTIVSTRGRSSREDFDYRAHRSGTWRVPLVVLIDRDTASASEIFAGAVRDNGRGTIVGERSYGKGSVQGIFPLTASRAGVRLTTAKFYSPNGQAISDRGVAPNKVVTITARPDYDTGALAEAPDAVVSAGIQTARQLTVANR